MPLRELRRGTFPASAPGIAEPRRCVAVGRADVTRARSPLGLGHPEAAPAFLPSQGLDRRKDDILPRAAECRAPPTGTVFIKASWSGL